MNLNKQIGWISVDEAIKHAEEVSSRKFDDNVHCIKCAEKHRQFAEWLKDYKHLLEQEPCEDDISRKAEKYKEFAEWVAEEIFSEDWEYNKDSFEEVACRKLEKIGIVRKSDTSWVLVESEEQEMQRFTDEEYHMWEDFEFCITDDDIEKLKQGETLYGTVNSEFTVILKYCKIEPKESDDKK